MGLPPSLPPQPPFRGKFRRAGLLAKTLLALAPSPPDLAHTGDLKGDPGLPDRASRYSGGRVPQESHVAVLVRSSTTVYSGRRRRPRRLVLGRRLCRLSPISAAASVSPVHHRFIGLGVGGRDPHGRHGCGRGSSLHVRSFHQRCQVRLAKGAQRCCAKRPLIERLASLGSRL